jgi:YqaJ-like viral recombinase domain
MMIFRNIKRKYRHLRKIASGNTVNPDYGTHCEKPDMPDEEIRAGGERTLALLTVTLIEQQLIEKETRGQASNSRWFEERRQRLTASNFGEVCKRRAPPGPLVKRILYSVNFTSAAIEWGKEHESTAITAYEKAMNVKYNFAEPLFEVHPCGLFIDVERGYLAASPDGVVGQDKIIEVKCPYSARHMTPLHATNELKNFYCRANDKGQLILDRRHKYYYQVSI